jgi:DNA uptake protein ComE-like DNA-binding protein
MSVARSPSDDRSRYWFIWTLPQRRALLVVVALLWVVLAARYAMNSRYISDPQPDVPDRAAELADRLDPNTAEWQDLAALPNLGEKRAKAIVEFREARRATRDPVFTSADDLLLIKGIGVATVTKLKPYLVFQPAPVTKP